MKKILLSLLILSCSPAFLLSVHAQSPTATSSADTIRDSVKQKVTEELAQIKKGVAKKGFVGSVSSISDGIVTINTFMLQPRKALVTADTTIKLLGGSDGTTGDLKVGQYVLALGDVDSQNTMTTKRLLIIAKPIEDTRKVVFGALLKNSSTSFTVGTETYKITSTTKFTNKTKATDLAVGAKIMAIVNSSNIATRIQIVSPVISSTPSATPRP